MVLLFSFRSYVKLKIIIKSWTSNSRVKWIKFNMNIGHNTTCILCLICNLATIQYLPSSVQLQRNITQRGSEFSYAILLDCLKWM